MRTPSSQLEILGSLDGDVAVVVKVKRVGSLDATALDKSGGHKLPEAAIPKRVTLKVMVGRVMEESALERRWWGLQGRGSGILVVQERGVDATRRLWSWGVQGRGNIWTFWRPYYRKVGERKEESNRAKRSKHGPKRKSGARGWGEMEM